MPCPFPPMTSRKDGAYLRSPFGKHCERNKSCRHRRELMQHLTHCGRHPGPAVGVGGPRPRSPHRKGNVVGGFGRSGATAALTGCFPTSALRSLRSTACSKPLESAAERSNRVESWLAGHDDAWVQMLYLLLNSIKGYQATRLSISRSCVPLRASTCVRGRLGPFLRQYSAENHLR
jgi:hypothetical protein